MDGAGSMTRRNTILFILMLLTGSVRAILPPDAKAREPQLRAYRQRLTDSYEERQAERQAEAVQAYERTRAEIVVPPWMRSGRTAVSPGSGTGSAGLAGNASKRNHRILVSIMLLILIICVVGWIRYATREQDE
jgi:hypothetical protein